MRAGRDDADRTRSGVCRKEGQGGEREQGQEWVGFNLGNRMAADLLNPEVIREKMGVQRENQMAFMALFIWPPTLNKGRISLNWK